MEKSKISSTNLHFDLAVLHKFFDLEYMIFTLKPSKDQEDETQTELVFLEKKQEKIWNVFLTSTKISKYMKDLNLESSPSDFIKLLSGALKHLDFTITEKSIFPNFKFLERILALEVKYRVLDTLTLKGNIVLTKVASKKKDSDKYCKYMMGALSNFFVHRSKLYKNSKNGKKTKIGNDHKKTAANSEGDNTESSFSN